MKTTLLAILCFGLSLSTAFPQKHLRLPDGRLIEGQSLRLTLTDDFASAISTNVRGKVPAVEKRAFLQKLHPDILRIEVRHLSARRWLNGEALPASIKLRQNEKVARIARNVTLILKPQADTLAVAEALRNLPQVERVSLKTLSDLDALPNDPSYTLQWGMNRIGVPDGDWDVAGRGRVRVAIIDSGVDRQHPDLSTRIVFGGGYAADAPSDGDAPVDRRNGFDHGTHVAGIVGAIRNNNTGVAGSSNNIDLMAMGCAVWSDVAPAGYRIGNADDAMDDAVANGASVMNCSFGSNRANGRVDLDAAKNDALINANNNNVLVVVSAGNAAMDTTNHDWAQSSVPWIVSAAMQANPTTGLELFDTSYSNFGPRIDMCAPGTGILSTLPTGGPGGSLIYANKNGTSMASPHVAGAAAHILSMDPTRLEDDSAKHLLIRMSQDAGPTGKDNQYGWGLLRMRRDFLEALSVANGYVSNIDAGFQFGTYDNPYQSLALGVSSIPNGGVLILNGGNVGAASFHYPAITITKPCTLTALPDSPVVIGQ